MLIMRDTKLGFNKNVIIIHFEEFIDLQRLHMLNGRDMLMTRMGTLSVSLARGLVFGPQPRTTRNHMEPQSEQAV